MTLVERLRGVAGMDLRTGGFLAHTMDTAKEAADEIERLRRDCAELYQVIGVMAEFCPEDPAIIKALDNASDGAAGRPRRHDDLLPFTLPVALEQKEPPQGRWVSDKEYHHDPACSITMGGQCNCGPEQKERSCGHPPEVSNPQRFGIPQGPTFPPMGCICPPTSERTCQNPMCPRRSHL